MSLAISFMVSDSQLDVGMFRRDLKNIPRAFRRQPSDVLPSIMNNILHPASVKPGNLLTVGDYLHILDKAMDNFKDLRGGQFGLVLGESVQPLENRLDILLSSAQPLDKFLCVTLCQVVYNMSVNTN
jgi:hypothetical protein